MGIITNGPTEHQLKKVKKLGLYDYVDPKHVIVSQATGFQKPEKEIFNLAAEQFDMNPSTTLYVGDSYDNDVMGAFNSGWHSMWFNHRGRSLKPGTKPVFDLEIDSFEQLFGAVKVLFDLPNNKFIFDINDKENPVLQLGINNGLMMAAERLLESNMRLIRWLFSFVWMLTRKNSSYEVWKIKNGLTRPFYCLECDKGEVKWWGTDNLKYDIEALSTERDAFRK